MLSLRDALESALVENPDDLATHHAYADYLQEQGDPRGEFIQLQLALEEPQRTEAERRQLQARARELLHRHQQEWLGLLAEDLLPPQQNGEWPLRWSSDFYYPTEHQFARGWLDSLTVRNGESIRRPDRLGPLLCLSPQMRLLRKLVLECDDGLLEELLTSPFLMNLRVFQLGRARNSFVTPSHVVQAPLLAALIARLPRIEELRLFAQYFDAARLFALPNLSSLRILQIYYLVERYPLEVLADNAALHGLTHLLLRPSPTVPSFIDLAGVRAIVQSPHLRNLKHLQVHCSDLGDVGCTDIVTSGILKRLKVLDLRHGEITDTGARILADCPDLRRLELLDIERNALTQVGIDALRRVLGSALRADNQLPPEEQDRRQYLYDEDFD